MSGLLDRVRHTLFGNRARIKTYLIAASVLFGALLILKGGIWIIHFFSNINFTEVGHVAFLAGIVSGLGLVALFSIGARALSPRPEPVYRMVLKTVSNNGRVIARLGEPITPGKFRAYSIVEGELRVRSNSAGPTSTSLAPSPEPGWWQRIWKPRRVQMLFTLNGSRTTGIVSAEVQMDERANPFFRLLAMDVVDGPPERIVLHGDPNYKIEQGPVKLA